MNKHGRLGVDVSPPLSDVKVKPPKALLSDILDPNRMFEARSSGYQIETKVGRTLAGLILEAAITKEQMSDLLAFLLGK